MVRVLMAMVVVLGGALFLACGGDDDDEATVAPTAEPTEAGDATPTATEVEEEETPTPTVEVTDVEVTMTDDTITLDVDSAPAGLINFITTNNGELNHALVIVQTDLAPDALPTTAAGAFDLAFPDDAIILAQTPGILGGVAGSELKYELEAGNYVLISNQLNDTLAGGTPDYAAGMYVAFTVE